MVVLTVKVLRGIRFILAELSITPFYGMDSPEDSKKKWGFLFNDGVTCVLPGIHAAEDVVDVFMGCPEQNAGGEA